MRRRRPPDVFNDPELLELLGDDPELLAIADAITQTQRQPDQHRRKRVLLVAAAIAIAVLIAVPALAALTGIIDFHTAAPAPRSAVIDFASLDRQAPNNMGPDVIANEGRRIDLHFGATTITITIAPTKAGGFCYQLQSPAVQGCDSHRQIPFELGVAADQSTGPAIAYGAALHPAAASVELRTADGDTTTIRLDRISEPIDAAFYIAPINPLQLSLPLTATVRDAHGHILGSKRIDLPHELRREP